MDSCYWHGRLACYFDNYVRWFLRDGCSLVRRSSCASHSLKFNGNARLPEVDLHVDFARLFEQVSSFGFQNSNT